jgi:hypothetical protein
VSLKTIRTADRRKAENRGIEWYTVLVLFFVLAGACALIAYATRDVREQRKALIREAVREELREVR